MDSVKGFLAPERLGRSCWSIFYLLIASCAPVAADSATQAARSGCPDNFRILEANEIRSAIVGARVENADIRAGVHETFSVDGTYAIAQLRVPVIGNYSIIENRIVVSVQQKSEMYPPVRYLAKDNDGQFVYCFGRVPREPAKIVIVR